MVISLIITWLDNCYEMNISLYLHLEAMMCSSKHPVNRTCGDELCTHVLCICCVHTCFVQPQLRCTCLCPCIARCTLGYKFGPSVKFSNWSESSCVYWNEIYSQVYNCLGRLNKLQFSFHIWFIFLGVYVKKTKTKNWNFSFSQFASLK